MSGSRFDFVGTVTLTAQGDGTGTFISGSYSWVGGSVDLGIALGTTLLSGTLSSVEYLPGSSTNAPLFQSTGTIDNIDSILGTTVGPADRILIYDYQQPFPEWSGGLWSASFVRNTSYTGGPDLYGAPALVSEPGMLALLGIGLVVMAYAGRRKLTF